MERASGGGSHRATRRSGAPIFLRLSHLRQRMADVHATRGL